MMRTNRPPPIVSGPGLQEDRSLDWFCRNCSERNFTKRFECFKCKAARPAPNAPPNAPVIPPAPRRTLSPHAGSRAMREMLKAQAVPKPSPPRERSKSASSSSTPRRKKRGRSSSSSSRKDRRRRSRSRKQRRKRGSSSSSSERSSSVHSAEPIASSSAAGQEVPTNPEIEKAKADVLEKLLKLKQVEPRDARIREWRALLREWHPDKNPDRTDVATAVFQFLQKGKTLIDADVSK